MERDPIDKFIAVESKALKIGLKGAEILLRPIIKESGLVLGWYAGRKFGKISDRVDQYLIRNWKRPTTELLIYKRS